MAFHQMVHGTITKSPPYILQRTHTPASTFVEFFGLTNDTTLISPEMNYLGQFQGFEMNPEVDVQYEHMILGMRDSRLFNPFYLLAVLNGE